MKNWKIAGASTQGTSHLKLSTPCQDSHAYAQFPDGTLVIAVADGAGSAKHSELGSAEAVKAVIAFAQSAVFPQLGVGWMRFLLNAFEQARLALETLAPEENVDLRDLACTLWVVVVTDELVAVARLGDGFAVAQLEDGSFFSLMRQQKGEYANETVFLTVPDAIDRVEIMVYHASVKSVAVSTDGLVRLAMQMKDWTPFDKFFQPLVQSVAEAENEEAGCAWVNELLNSERVNARADDDKTLVTALRVEEAKP